LYLEDNGDNKKIEPTGEEENIKTTNGVF